MPNQSQTHSPCCVRYLQAFYAHVEDLQAQHDAERSRTNAQRAERETERAAEKDAWQAQSWLEVQAARVEAEGKVELEKMAFHLQLDVLRAELADERRIMATKEVEHIEAITKQEALLTDTVLTLGVQHQASIESHAIEIDRLKAAAIEVLVFFFDFKPQLFLICYSSLVIVSEVRRAHYTRPKSPNSVSSSKLQQRSWLRAPKRLPLRWVCTAACFVRALECEIGHSWPILNHTQHCSMF